MTFETTYKMLKESEGLKRRIVAAAAAAGRADAPTWVEQNAWGMVPLMVTPPDGGGSSQAWWQVWEFAEATREDWDKRDIGGRTEVILDEWIAQVVQTHIDNLATSTG